MLLTAKLHTTHTKEQLLADNTDLPNDHTIFKNKLVKL